MMKSISIAVFLAALATTASAADMAKPVRTIMDLAVARTSLSYDGDADYFDDAHIGNFSAELQALYAEASKHPAYDTDEETGSPFDYDPIAMGNGGCSIEDLTVEVAGKDEKATDVVVRSKDDTCYEDGSEEERNAVTVRHFRVILEGGKPVIDDFTAREGEDRFSLKETLKAIAEE